MGHRQPTIAGLIGSAVIDPELAALLWLLGEGGIPMVVSGRATPADRGRLAVALASVTPVQPGLVIDADIEPLGVERLSTLVLGSARLVIVLAAEDLADVLHRLGGAPHDLPEDATRRLGVVLIVGEAARVPRVTAAHYLRPTERDGQGHLQRRPPAVLATWDAETSSWEHFSWGITPELADRIDRSQADLEERQEGRARFLADAAAAGLDGQAWLDALERELASEPPRPSAIRGGLGDPGGHVH